MGSSLSRSQGTSRRESTMATYVQRETGQADIPSHMLALYHEGRVYYKGLHACGHVCVHRRTHACNTAAKLRDKLPSNLKQAMDFGGEKGASHWLVVLPLSEHGFTLQGAFRDAIKLRCGWQLPHLRSHCTCGKKFTVEHAFSCPCGGFPSLTHNDIRDITADFLTEVSPSVLVEPRYSHLQGNYCSTRQQLMR